MRRTLLLGLGVLEILVAVALLAIALNLPGRTAVNEGFGRVEKITGGAEKQVRQLRDQVADLRRRDVHDAAERLAKHTHTITSGLQDRDIDFRAIEGLSVALGDAAKGLEGWSQTLDGDRLAKLGEGLTAAADFLDRDAAEAGKAADGLEQATAGLERDGRRLAALLRKAPPDLKALREIHDSLARFDAGLEKMGGLLKLDRFDAIREGFAGMESSLGTTADQVDKLGGYSYPVVKLNGLKPPEVDMKPFWPEGPKIAEGLRKAVGGVQAANKELSAVNKDLPAIRASLEESRKAIGKTRDAMASALKQQGEVESLLQAVPKQSAALADELPRLGQSFAKVLRETARLKELAVSLRGVRKGLDETAARWPDLAKTMQNSAKLLRGTQDRLDAVLKRRPQYEKAIKESAQLAQTFADLLPLFTDQLDSRLGQQEHALSQMEQGLSEVNGSLPQTAQTAGDLLAALRWLAVLVAGLIGLHGAYVLVESRIRRPQPAPANGPTTVAPANTP